MLKAKKLLIQIGKTATTNAITENPVLISTFAPRNKLINMTIEQLKDVQERCEALRRHL